jgi:hypothetical protein
LHPLQPSDTSSPAATLNSLIRSCNELHELIKTGPVTEERADEILPTTDRILDCLDLTNLPAELRNFLKEVLDRTLMRTFRNQTQIRKQTVFSVGESPTLAW